MRYRKLDANGDYSFGRRLKDFHIDVPDAPAQAVYTRLMLWQGEWFLAPDDGMPWATEVLGKYTENYRDPAIRARIVNTPSVSEIVEYASQVNRENRAMSVQVKIDTEYGGIAISMPYVEVPSQEPSQPPVELRALTTQSGIQFVTHTGATISAQRPA